MNNNFITVVLSMLILALLVCLTVFGVNAYKELQNPTYTTGVEQLEGESSSIAIREKIETPKVVEQTSDEIPSISNNDNNITYQSSANNTRYFYNQLDEYSKIIYDGMASNVDNLKTGTYTIRFGNAFSSLLSKNNGDQILETSYQSAIEAFTYDNPMVFYLDPTKMFLNIKTTTRGNNKKFEVSLKNSGNEKYLAKGFESEEQINQCQAEIEQIKNQVINQLSGDTYKKVRQIHDFLVENLEYDQTVSNPNIYNLYGALVNRDCVCEGYAKAFKYLSDEAGLNCVIIVGDATNSKGQIENHAWNYVDLDGTWYAIDTTWDDPIVQGGGRLSYSHKHKYFLKGLATMNKDHTPNGQFTDGGKIFSYPTISNSDYR